MPPQTRFWASRVRSSLPFVRLHRLCLQQFFEKILCPGLSPLRVSKKTARNIFLINTGLITWDDGPRKVIYERQNAERQKSARSGVLLFDQNSHCASQTFVCFKTDRSGPTWPHRAGRLRLTPRPSKNATERGEKETCTGCHTSLAHVDTGGDSTKNVSFHWLPWKEPQAQKTETAGQTAMSLRRLTSLSLFSQIAIRNTRGADEIFWRCRCQGASGVYTFAVACYDQSCGPSYGAGCPLEPKYSHNH